MSSARGTRSWLTPLFQAFSVKMKKGKLMRGAEGGQQDWELHPSANPLHSTDFVCRLCGMGDLQNFIHFLKHCPNMTFCRSACYGRSFANDKTWFSGLHHLNYNRLL